MNYDAIIIGFGKGGKTLAGSLAAKGKKVALVEKSDKMYGGTCINVGCIPSKSLVHSAAASAAHKKDDFDKKTARYAAAVAERERVTSMLRKKNYDKLNDNANVTVINGTAAFVDAKTVRVKTAGEEFTLTADNIFINTGSTSVIPKIDGIENNEHVYYSDTLMSLETLPNQLIIIGGGYIGLEFASMYANFGSKVTVLQDTEQFIPREDDDIADAIRKTLEGQGIQLKLGAKIQGVSKDGTVSYEWQGAQYGDKADAILIATGRRPNTDSLNLSAANVETTPRGAVKVDELLRTTQPGIWAMGDVTGGLQFTYTSLDDYRIVAKQLNGAGDYSLNARKNVPYSVFMATPFARVGLNEREAVKAGYEVKIAKMPAAAIPKAQVLNKTQGMLKAVIDAKTDKILGVMLLCEESYEMINTVKTAMDFGASYQYLRDNIFTHPTMTEALNDLFSI